MSRFLFLAFGMGLLLTNAPESKSFGAQCFPLTAAYAINNYVDGGATFQEALRYEKWNYRETDKCRAKLKNQLQKLGFTRLPSHRERWRK